MVLPVHFSWLSFLCPFVLYSWGSRSERCVAAEVIGTRAMRALEMILAAISVLSKVTKAGCVEKARPTVARVDEIIVDLGCLYPEMMDEKIRESGITPMRAKMKSGIEFRTSDRVVSTT